MSQYLSSYGGSSQYGHTVLQMREQSQHRPAKREDQTRPGYATQAGPRIRLYPRFASPQERLTYEYSSAQKHPTDGYPYPRRYPTNGHHYAKGYPTHAHFSSPGHHDPQEYSTNGFIYSKGFQTGGSPYYRVTHAKRFAETENHHYSTESAKLPGREGSHAGLGENQQPSPFYAEKSRIPDENKTYSLLEFKGLSKRLELDDVQTTGPSSSTERDVWLQHKTYLDPNTTTELRDISNVELSTYVANREKITLSCASGPTGQVPDSPGENGTMKWL